VEDSLRAAMIRTAYSDTNLSPIPENCTFTLTIEMRDENVRPGNVSLLASHPLSIFSSCVVWRRKLIEGNDVALDAYGTSTSSGGEKYSHRGEYGTHSGCGYRTSEV